MQPFLMIAAAHFLALLSPGPDFFLVARTSLASGWRVASGACVGIALANGVFIAAAFAGIAILRHGSALFIAIQSIGCLYLLHLGYLFIRHAGRGSLEPGAGSSQHAGAPRAGSWPRAAGMGFLSGILNPKNALFYASLAAMLTGPHASTGWKLVYGTWMFCAVLLWDMTVAATIGNRAVLQRFSRAMPWLERITGVILMLIALGVAAMLALG
ncbi:LysE family translocator [Burkholderia sp. TSV86]|uniref:LysE family translocator n=1 Tax=Burkholderia sp. TSV86 TaxID=1385594 RepID=UPI00075452A0|nr:LysE family translocator [Burkholderia sp. TSV86]KVE37747.1 lysine transporter LysE [Burkholderia sp. TSV86]